MDTVKYKHKTQDFNIYVQFNLYHDRCTTQGCERYFQALQENYKPYFTNMLNLERNFVMVGNDKSDRIQKNINISIKNAKKYKKSLTL